MFRDLWTTLTQMIRTRSSHVYASVRVFETSHSKYFRRSWWWLLNKQTNKQICCICICLEVEVKSGSSGCQASGMSMTLKVSISSEWAQSLRRPSTYSTCSGLTNWLIQARQRDSDFAGNCVRLGDLTTRPAGQWPTHPSIALSNPIQTR